MCERALSNIIRFAPGHVYCNLLLAQTLFLQGDMEGATQSACVVQRIDPEEGRASLILCQVYMHQNKLTSARLTLDEAIAGSFTIRKLTQYHIVNGQILLAENRLSDSKHVSECSA